MAPALLNPTVAAGLKSFLRASVNAVRGHAFERHAAAKVGNATTITGDIPHLPAELRGGEPRIGMALRGERRENDPRLGNVARHCEGGL